MAVRSTADAELYADRFNLAFSMRLEPPAGSVGLLFLRNAGGTVLASGRGSANDTLVFLPDGSGADIVAKGLTGSEALTLSSARFLDLTGALCPTLSPARLERPWRVQGDPGTLEAIKTARAGTRRRVWAAGADPGFYVIDIDATLVGSHSDKEQAAPTYKRGFGFHPLLAYLDATGEALAGLLRPGNAGSGTATDHIAVLDDALTQLPINPTETEVIARADSAGWSHGFVNACRDRHVNFVIGHALDIDVAKVLIEVPKRRWQEAISADGTDLREHAEVVEITDLVDLSGWPDGCRMIARRELAHPGAQLTFTDVDGHRFQVFVTDLTDSDIAYLEALYRGRGRAERQICDTKATGLANLPSHSFAINHIWLQLCLTAHDLLAWTRLLTLDGDLATAEPKRLRYCLMHTAGHIITTGRRRFCRLSDTWPWTTDLIAAFDRLHTIRLQI